MCGGVPSANFAGGCVAPWCLDAIIQMPLPLDSDLLLELQDLGRVDVPGEPLILPRPSSFDVGIRAAEK